jgi:hypothetical protein
MLGKLFRYECKALLRILPVLYLANLVLSVVVGIWVKQTNFNFTGWMMMSIPLFVITIALVIQRFRNNFLKDEGYLMFTLPVSPWQLVASKALAAFCAFVAACVVTALSNMIFWSVSGFSTVSEFFTSILWLIKLEYGDEILAWVAPLFLLITVQQLFLIYACITVSQIAPRFRGLIGFAVYLAVLLLVEAPLNTRVSNALADGMLTLWIMAVIQAVFAAVYFIASVKLLEHTFNME